MAKFLFVLEFIFSKMHTLKHNFSFRGQLSQSVHPDIFLTTKDAGSTDFIQAHRVVLAAVSDKLHGMCKEGGRVFIRKFERWSRHAKG